MNNINDLIKSELNEINKEMEEIKLKLDKLIKQKNALEEKKEEENLIKEKNIK